MTTSPHSPETIARLTALDAERDRLVDEIHALDALGQADETAWKKHTDACERIAAEIKEIYVRVDGRTGY